MPACARVSEWNSCLPAGNREGESPSVPPEPGSRLEVTYPPFMHFLSPVGMGQGKAHTARVPSFRASRHMGHLLLQTACDTAGAIHVPHPSTLSTSTAPWESVPKQEKHTLPAKLPGPSHTRAWLMLCRMLG